MRTLLKVINKTKVKVKRMKRMNKKVKIKSNEGLLFYFIVLTVYIFTKSVFIHPYWVIIFMSITYN